MRKILLFAFTALTLSACKDSKTGEKTALNDVIKIHDKVMGYDEQLMQNKMKLDTLLQVAKNDDAKAKIKELIAKLAKADSIMEDWMQNFDPAQKGKSHADIMNYMSVQKKQILAVDSLLERVVKESGEYLKPFKK